MRSYYDRRAPEYDAWWEGTGRYRDVDRPGWAEEVARLVEILRSLSPASVIDVACGTGYLTRHLRGPRVVAIDQSPAMARIAKARLPHAEVVVGDAVPLPMRSNAFDRILTANFYGHLQPGEAHRFLDECRRVAAELIVIDAHDARGAREEWQPRTLADGSAHLVYKRYFTPASLAAELGGATILHAGRHFLMARA